MLIKIFVRIIIIKSLVIPCSNFPPKIVIFAHLQYRQNPIFLAFSARYGGNKKMVRRDIPP